MSTYLLVITPDRITKGDHSQVFLNLIGCNLYHEPSVWNGTISGSDGTTGTLWATLLQMQDRAIDYGSEVTVVWSPDPLDETVDPQRILYTEHRAAIVKIIDDIATDLSTHRPEDAAYFSGCVCWVLKNANTSVLADDLAKGYRAQFTLIKGAKVE